MKKREKHLKKCIYFEFYFQNNDYEKPLNGDGQYSGFLIIAENYSSTKSGNLAELLCIFVK